MKNAISKTKIKKDLKRKTNPRTLEIIELARKQKNWLPLAKFIAGPTRNYISMNLEVIDKKIAGGEVAVIPGKVLGIGEISKKAKICAISFSESAIEKMKKGKIDYCFISDEIKKNPDAKGVKIIK